MDPEKLNQMGDDLMSLKKYTPEDVEKLQDFLTTALIRTQQQLVSGVWWKASTAACLAVIKAAGLPLPPSLFEDIQMITKAQLKSEFGRVSQEEYDAILRHLQDIESDLKRVFADIVNIPPRY